MGDDAGAWITRYITAWGTNDPEDVRELFAPDATYRFNPWTDAVVGRDEIVREWLERQDEAGTWTFDWSPLADCEGLFLIQATTAYSDGTVYSNLWAFRLDDQGRATEFTEWWMDHEHSA